MKKQLQYSIVGLFSLTILLFSNNIFAQPGSNPWGEGSAEVEIASPDEETMPSYLDTKRIPWEDKDLLNAGQLANDIKSGAAEKTLILNIGAVRNIKGAVDIGAVEQDENMKKFIQYVAKLDKDRDITIYCGCCPLDVCPNAKRAYSYLKKRGFTNYALLNLPKNLFKDWEELGYPMAK